MSTYNTILSELQKVNTETMDTVYVPSAEKEINFRRLNVKAQKDIIRSALDSDGTNISFNLHANNMIYDHTEARNLLITDRGPILLAMRSNNLTDIVNVDDSQVSIESVLSDIEDKTSKLKLRSTSSHENITVFLSVPTLETDTRFLAACKKEISGIVDTENVGDSVGIMYVYELAKVIDRVQYKMTTPSLSGSDEVADIHTVKFSSTDVNDCVSMVELLPTTINKQIVDFITQIREIERESSTDTETNVQIPIDVSLFTLD